MKKKSAQFVAAIACVAIGVGLAGCSNGLEDGTSRAGTSSSTKADTSASPKADTSASPKATSATSPKATSATSPKATAPASGASSTEATSGKAKATAVNQVIDDSAMKVKITVIEYIRGLPAQDPAIAARGDEMVLVHLNIDHSNVEYSYYLTFASQFRIDSPASMGQSASSDLVKKYMSANGYQGFDSVKGQVSVDGWVAMYIKKNAPDLTLKYRRSGATVIGSNVDIPRFDATVPLK